MSNSNGEECEEWVLLSGFEWARPRYFIIQLVLSTSETCEDKSLPTVYLKPRVTARSVSVGPNYKRFSFLAANHETQGDVRVCVCKDIVASPQPLPRGTISLVRDILCTMSSCRSNNFYQCYCVPVRVQICFSRQSSCSYFPPM